MKEIQTKSCNIIVVDNQGVISLLIKESDYEGCYKSYF